MKAKKPKWEISKKARRILRQAAIDIMEQPHLYDQNQDRIPDNACGTKGCIYGFIAARLPRTEVLDHRLFSPITRLMGFGEYREDAWMDYEGGENHPGGRLFYCWPEEYKELYSYAEETENDLGKALVAVSRIRHFIRTGE